MNSVLDHSVLRVCLTWLTSLISSGLEYRSYQPKVIELTCLFNSNCKIFVTSGSEGVLKIYIKQQEWDRRDLKGIEIQNGSRNASQKAAFIKQVSQNANKAEC